MLSKDMQRRAWTICCWYLLHLRQTTSRLSSNWIWSISKKPKRYALFTVLPLCRAYRKGWWTCALFKMGLTGVKRVESLNADPVFVRALADIVANHLSQPPSSHTSVQMKLRCPDCINATCLKSKTYFAQQPIHWSSQQNLKVSPYHLVGLLLASDISVDFLG